MPSFTAKSRVTVDNKGSGAEGLYHVSKIAAEGGWSGGCGGRLRHAGPQARSSAAQEAVPGKPGIMSAEEAVKMLCMANDPWPAAGCLLAGCISAGCWPAAFAGMLLASPPLLPSIYIRTSVSPKSASCSRWADPRAQKRGQQQGGGVSFADVAALLLHIAHC